MFLSYQPEIHKAKFIWKLGPRIKLIAHTFFLVSPLPSLDFVFFLLQPFFCLFVEQICYMNHNVSIIQIPLLDFISINFPIPSNYKKLLIIIMIIPTVIFLLCFFHSEYAVSAIDLSAALTVYDRRTKRTLLQHSAEIKCLKVGPS